MSSLSEHDVQLINKYLLGQLSESEKQTFETRLSDDDFAAEYEFLSSTKRVSEKIGERQLRSVFAGIDQEMGTPKTRNGFLIPGILKWLIAFLGLAILLYVLFQLFNPKEIQPDRLFAEFYEPMPNMVAPIEKGISDQNEYETAFRSYERGAFQDALQQFEALDSEDAAVVFYKGLAHLALDKMDLAISLLDQSAQKNDSDFRDAADWYLILAYLKVGDLTEVEQRLVKVLSNADHRYKTRAVQLMQKIK